MAPQSTEAWPLGQQIAAARRAQGIKSARAAARLAGIDEAVWRRLESGVVALPGGHRVPYKPSIETLHKVAQALVLDYEVLADMADRGAEGGSTVVAGTDDVDPIHLRLSQLEERLSRIEAALDMAEAGENAGRAEDAPRPRRIR